MEITHQMTRPCRDSTQKIFYRWHGQNGNEVTARVSNWRARQRYFVCVASVDAKNYQGARKIIASFAPGQAFRRRKKLIRTEVVR